MDRVTDGNGNYDRKCYNCGMPVQVELEELLGGGQAAKIGCACTVTRVEFEEVETWEEP